MRSWPSSLRAHIGLLDGEQPPVNECAIAFAIEAGILMEERRRAIAGEAVGGPAHHGGPKRSPKPPASVPYCGSCLTMTVARGYQRGHEDGPACLLVRRIEHLVFGGQGRRMFSRIDDGVPFAGFERIAGTDVHAKDMLSRPRPVACVAALLCAGSVFGWGALGSPDAASSAWQGRESAHIKTAETSRDVDVIASAVGGCPYASIKAASSQKCSCRRVEMAVGISVEMAPFVR